MQDVSSYGAEACFTMDIEISGSSHRCISYTDNPVSRGHLVEERTHSGYSDVFSVCCRKSENTDAEGGGKAKEEVSREHGE